MPRSAAKDAAGQQKKQKKQKTPPKDEDCSSVDDGLQNSQKGVLSSKDPAIKHFVRIKAWLNQHPYLSYYQCRAQSDRNPPRLSCPLLAHTNATSSITRGCSWYMILSAAECKNGWLRVQLKEPAHPHTCDAMQLSAEQAKFRAQKSFDVLLTYLAKKAVQEVLDTRAAQGPRHPHNAQDLVHTYLLMLDNPCEPIHKLASARSLADILWPAFASFPLAEGQ